MSLRRALVLTVAALLVVQSHPRALDPFKRLSQMGHRAFTRQQGLPQDSVRAIAQTADGTLWLGTDEGLAAFDGTEFTVYRRGDAGLPSSSITALMAARDGSLWVGTLAGVSHFHRGRFDNFDEHNGLGTQAASSFAETPDGTVWVAGGLVVSTFRDGRVANLGADRGVPVDGLREFVVTGDGLWGAGIGTVVRWTGAAFVPAAADTRLDGNIILAIDAGTEHDVWLAGTRGVAHVRLDGRTDVYGAREGLPEDIARAIQVDRDGNVWVGSNTGIARFEGTRFVPVAAAGLAPTIWDLFEDQDGGLWAGTNAGLHQFTTQPFTVYGVPEGFPSDQPNAVYQAPDGAFWFGFRDAGVLRLAQGRLTRVTQRDGLAADEVFAIRGGLGGEVLVGTRLGLTTIVQGRAVRTTHLQDALNRQAVYDVLVDGPDRLWLATHGGVVRVERGRQERVVPGGSLLADAAVVLARQADGTIWSGTYGQGLWRYRAGQVTHFTEKDGLSSDAIRALTVDRRGTLWIGTAGGGLAWVHDGRLGHLTRDEGLESDTVGQIIEGEGDDLWLGTTVGLVRVDTRAVLTAGASPPRPHLFLSSEGLRSSHAAPGFPLAAGGIRDRDGRIWAVTANGVASFKPSDVPIVDAARRARITAIVADGQVLDPEAPIRLPAGARRVEFHYASTSLVAPERLRYRYRLEGFDASWTEAGTRRFAEYSHLPPGPYRFVVTATREGGAVDEEARVIVTQQAQWYEMPWFPYAVLSGLVTLGASAYWLRLRRLQARYQLVLEERIRLSRELHDTVSQDFVGISSQLAGAAQAIREDPAAAEQRVGLARRMAQHGLTEARRSIMDLRSSALNGRDLVAAIDYVTQELTAGTGLRAQVTGSASAAVEQQVEQQIVRMAQEAIANVVKHAQATAVDVRVASQDGRVVVTVSDDGRGFDPSRVSAAADGHFGLLGMRERARRVGGDVRVESAAGMGARVVIDVPAR